MDVLIVLLIIFGIYMIISAYTRRPRRMYGNKGQQQVVVAPRMKWKKKKKKTPTTPHDDAKKRLDSI
jgi:hypothetical protein